jgi:uncharacterized tellurite resistance protein B-like protein
MKIMDKLRNLLVMAASDGRLTEREVNYLADRCKKWGLPESSFSDAITYALSEEAELTLPPRESERIEMLQDLMSMMAADGNLAETERHLFAIAAARMEISEERLNRMIDKLTRTK